MPERFPTGLKWMVRFHRQIVIVVQLVLMALSNWFAFALRFDGAVPDWAMAAFWSGLPWLIAIRTAVFVPFRLYEGLWRYTSIYDLRALSAGIAVSSGLFFAAVQLGAAPASYPRSVFIVDALILLLLLGGVRLTRRFYSEFARSAGGKRVLIFGAGDAGELIVRDMKADKDRTYEPIGFVDDNASKVGRRIHGVPVLGTRANLSAIVATHAPEEILIAIPTAEPAVIRQVVRSLQTFKVPLKTLPRLRDIIDGRIDVGQIRSVSVEDLLARAPIGLSAERLKTLIAGRRILVTGAGGSIGSELCRQIAQLEPLSLVMLDRYENSLHDIVGQLIDAGGASSLYAVIGDVTDAVRIDAVFARYQPQIVFHAAAHKHVPLMESSPCEAVKNNVRGTRILAEAAERYGVDRFIMISTDKAVNPTSVMGATKRVAELLIQLRQIGSGTSFATVRFGNVLASNGSVVPRFVEQIRRGGPITVTHPEMRRFFMLIPEAVQLVLHSAAQAETGGTYVLEMGEQIKVLDMARDMIRLSGLVPDEDIAIQFVGLRPGEKLFEELVARGEKVGPSAIEKILKVMPGSPPDAAWRKREEELEAAALTGDESRTTALLSTLVEGYVSLIDEGLVAGTEESNAVAVAEQPSAATDPDRHSAPCPKCRSVALHRSRARSLWERIRRDRTHKRLYRCAECGWRGWMEPIVIGFGSTQDVAAPDLSHIDQAVGDGPAPSFLPRNLK